MGHTTNNSILILYCCTLLFSVTSGSPRPPFDDLIRRLVSLHDNNQIGQKRSVIVSVDIPSGWHVEEGDVDGAGIKPDMLVCFRDISVSLFISLNVENLDIIS